MRHYSPGSRSWRPSVSPVFAVLVLLVAALTIPWLGGCGKDSSGGVSGTPRAVTPRGDLAADEKSTIELFRNAAPSVAYITTVSLRTDAFNFNVLEIPRGTGSGFVWDEQGHVVTNYHVLAGSNAARVMLSDQKVHKAEVVGVAPDKDLAVLKIDAPADQLHPIPVGTSADLEVGQKVYAIGNPFGLDHTLTTGVISGLGREIQSVTDRPISDVIQTDAAINPGNSGGPLLDSAGRLIGVNTAILSRSGSYAGIGFAVPVDTVNRVVPDLIAHGQEVRPGFGVRIASDTLARSLGVKGVLVMEVPEGSAGAEAGMQPTQPDNQRRVLLGDVIVAVDGQKIENTGDLYRALADKDVGDKVTVTVRRDGQKVDLHVVLQQIR